MSSVSKILFIVFAFLWSASFPATEAVAQTQPQHSAVSGPNGKVSVEGGEYDDEGAFLAKGSYSLPLGQAFGIQIDGALGSIDDEIMGGGAVHLFHRRPDKYLFGLYGSYHTWDDINIWRVAGEFELYLDRVSLTSLVGAEGVEFPTTDGGLLVLNQDDEHVFAHVDASYYLTDDLKISGGYRYVSEVHLGAASIEYLLRTASIPISLFAEGHFGEEEFNRVTGGIKVYFGADNNKTLITRHRYDDPPNYTPVFPRIVTAAAASTAQGPQPPPICTLEARTFFVATPQDGNCVCPQGSPLAGGSPTNTNRPPPRAFACSP